MSIITKKISELSLLSSPSTNAFLPIQDGDTTYKIGLSNIGFLKNTTDTLNGDLIVKNTASTHATDLRVAFGDNSTNMIGLVANEDNMRGLWDYGINNWLLYSSGFGSTATKLLNGKSIGIKTSNTGGYETDQYGNFVHSTASTQNSWNIQNNAGSNVFGVNFENGHVTNNELMTFAGNNITNGKANDTLTFWVNQGTCYCLFSQTNMLNGQPTQWGFLESIVRGTQVYQTFKAQPNGKIWCRGAHAGDTNMPDFKPVNAVQTGSWTPVMGRSTTTATEGVWYYSGSFVLLVGQITFSSTQTNQGGIYIDQSSLPSIARGTGIFGSGHVGGAMCILSSNTYINDNVFITISGLPATDATSSYIKGQTLRFVMGTIYKN